MSSPQSRMQTDIDLAILLLTVPAERTDERVIDVLTWLVAMRRSLESSFDQVHN
jgi:hypothetical protein